MNDIPVDRKLMTILSWSVYIYIYIYIAKNIIIYTHFLLNEYESFELRQQPPFVVI